MKWGVIRTLRSRPGGSAIAVLVAFVLPLLLGLLPPLAPTPAFALEQQIAASRCGPPGNGDHQPDQQGHQSCCILGHCCAAPAAAGPELLPVPCRKAAALPVSAPSAHIPLRSLRWSTAQARAPPST
jgi:hypothetical protein